MTKSFQKSSYLLANQRVMKVLIFGASGKTGQHLVSQALAEGHVVTAFARSPAKIKMQHQNLNIVQGNISDYNLVASAVKGQDVVLSALGAASPFKFDTVLVDGVGNIIKAMEANNVNRFIYLSFIGAGEGRREAGFVIRNIAPKLLKAEIEGHRQREKMIERSRLNWTIVHAPTLSNGPRKTVYRNGVDISSKGFVVSMSRADVADFMLKQLHHSHYLHSRARVMY
jgi:putative NADH-flavin reductase